MLFFLHNTAEELPSIRVLKNYRKAVKAGAPPLRIYLSRMTDDLETDILQLYKGKDINLTAEPKVRFEGEAGVGSGPVREFFPCPCSYWKRDCRMALDQTSVCSVLKARKIIKYHDKSPCSDRQVSLWQQARRLLTQPCMAVLEYMEYLQQ